MSTQMLSAASRLSDQELLAQVSVLAQREREATAALVAHLAVLDMLSEGAISLTTIRLLAPELTPANHRRLLEAARHQPTRQVEKLVAGLRPKPLVPSTIRQYNRPGRRSGDAGAVTRDPGRPSSGEANRGSPDADTVHDQVHGRHRDA